jgi:hypothetical protein
VGRLERELSRRRTSAFATVDCLVEDWATVDWYVATEETSRATDATSFMESMSLELLGLSHTGTDSCFDSIVMMILEVLFYLWR